MTGLALDRPGAAGSDIERSTALLDLGWTIIRVAVSCSGTAKGRSLAASMPCGRRDGALKPSEPRRRIGVSRRQIRSRRKHGAAPRPDVVVDGERMVSSGRLGQDVAAVSAPGGAKLWSISTLLDQFGSAGAACAHARIRRIAAASAFRIESPGTRSNIARCPDSVKVTVAPA